jgi:hypothetical protein
LRIPNDGQVQKPVIVILIGVPSLKPFRIDKESLSTSDYCRPSCRWENIKRDLKEIVLRMWTVWLRIGCGGRLL